MRKLCVKWPALASLNVRQLRSWWELSVLNKKKKKKINCSCNESVKYFINLHIVCLYKKCDCDRGSGSIDIWRSCCQLRAVFQQFKGKLMFLVSLENHNIVERFENAKRVVAEIEGEQDDRTRRRTEIAWPVCIGPESQITVKGLVVRLWLLLPGDRRTKGSNAISTNVPN